MAQGAMRAVSTFSLPRARAGIVARRRGAARVCRVRCGLDGKTGVCSYALAISAGALRGRRCSVRCANVAESLGDLILTVAGRVAAQTTGACQAELAITRVTMQTGA